MGRDSIRSSVAICLVNTGVFAGPYTAGLIIGGLIVFFGIDEAQAGTLLTIELLSLSVTSLSAAPLLTRVPRRRLAVCGAVLLLAGQFGSVLPGSFEILYGWRIMAGIGAGLLLATVNAVIASSYTPARLYGLATMVACLITAGLTPLMSDQIVSGGYTGYYRTLFVLMILVVVAALFIPDHLRKVESSARQKLDFLTEGMFLTVGIVIIGTAMMAYYAFIERLGVRAGLDQTAIGYVYTGLMIGSAVGGGLAAYVGQKFGVFIPLMIALILNTFSIMLAVFSSHAMVFAAAVVLQGLLFMFILPLQLTLAAELDVEGRWAAIASGASFISYGAGPFLGGWLITQVGYESIAWCMLAVTPPAMFIFFRVARQMAEPVSNSILS